MLEPATRSLPGALAKAHRSRWRACGTFAIPWQRCGRRRSRLVVVDALRGWVADCNGAGTVAEFQFAGQAATSPGYGLSCACTAGAED